MSPDPTLPPISYTVDAALGVIFEVWRGDVSGLDLRHHWEVFLKDPEVMAIRKTHADLREANILFTGNDLMQLVEKVAIPLLHGLEWKTAIVTRQAVQVGVSHQYQVFADLFSTDSLFEDSDEALRWLRS